MHIFQLHCESLRFTIFSVWVKYYCTKAKICSVYYIHTKFLSTRKHEIKQFNDNVYYSTNCTITGIAVSGTNCTITGIAVSGAQ